MPLNTSVWFLPSERPSTIEREAGVYPVSIGREQNFGGVWQIEHRFRTVREANYILFRMYGWYYAPAGRRPDGYRYFPKRCYEWRGPIPTTEVRNAA